MRADVAVPLEAQRTWQRKWRDVLHARQALADTYAGNALDVDDFTRRVENFFKTCHELGDWIEEATGRPAKTYAKQPPTLEVCDAVAQTAKHHTRQQSGSPITAIVVRLYGDHQKRMHADLEWNDNAGRRGKDDALKMADRCIGEWRRFFLQHSLNP
jgi:hypothetical protein